MTSIEEALLLFTTLVTFLMIALLVGLAYWRGERFLNIIVGFGLLVYAFSIQGVVGVAVSFVLGIVGIYTIARACKGGVKD